MQVEVDVESTIAPLDYDWLIVECKKALIEAAESMNVDFRAATHTWKHRPNFRYWGPFLSGNELYIEAGPWDNKKIFAMVDGGTKDSPNPITPKARMTRKGKPNTSPALRFRPGYTAKTQPYSMYARKGGRSGRYVYRYRVKHKGYKGREFIALSAANHQPWWNTRVLQIMQQFGGEVGMARRIHKVTR